ncbi:MAG: zinc ribbon domain-containing protein [Phycisphaerales bacterium]
MPMYEYVSEQDGTRLELLRPMSQADAPVEDPENKGRTFKRVHSTFAAAGSAAQGGSSSMGGCCPCGKNAGSCSRV